MLQYIVGTIPLNTRKERHYSVTLYHMHIQRLQAGGAETQGWLWPMYFNVFSS